MDPDDVGLIRCCPACGRGLVGAPFDFDGWDDMAPAMQLNLFEELRCTCCDRPWKACPCTPAEEGPCLSVDDSLPPPTLDRDEPLSRHPRIS
jgi:hypothetical protein